MTIDKSIEAAGKVIETVKSSPKGKVVVEELGESAAIVARAIHQCLLPIAAVSYGIEKARMYFQGQFEHDLGEKVSKIPPEEITEPKPSIAGPALQGLAFALEEQELKEMYLNLLTSSMDKRCAHKVHPSFASIIQQLTAEEARAIAIYLESVNFQIAVVRDEIKSTGGNFRVLRKHLLNVVSKDSLEPVVIQNLEAIIDNFVRLGLVEVDYTTHSVKPNAYDWVEKRPEYIELKNKHDSGSSEVKFQKGVLNRTSFGEAFARAVGITVSNWKA